MTGREMTPTLARRMLAADVAEHVALPVERVAGVLADLTPEQSERVSVLVRDAYWAGYEAGEWDAVPDAAVWAAGGAS